MFYWLMSDEVIKRRCLVPLTMQAPVMFWRMQKFGDPTGKSEGQMNYEMELQIEEEAKEDVNNLNSYVEERVRESVVHPKIQMQVK